MKKSYWIVSVCLLVALVSCAWFMLESPLHDVKNFGMVSEAVEEEPPVFVNAKAFETPRRLYFAGERVPLDEPDIRERFDKELYVNSYFHSSTIFLIKRANRWFPQMKPILKQANIPDDMVYLPLIESGFQQVKSPAGAAGYWQLMKATARELGLEVNDEVDERYHPIKSTHAAVKYLKKAYDKFGNWTNVAGSYNMGMNGLQRRIDKQRVQSYYDLLLNEESKRYVFRLLAIREIFTNQKKYGFYIPKSELYYPEKVETIKIEKSIPDLTAFAFEHGINYKILKRHNPWLRKNTLTIKKKGTTYEIEIPKK